MCLALSIQNRDSGIFPCPGSLFVAAGVKAHANGLMLVNEKSLGMVPIVTIIGLCKRASNNAKRVSILKAARHLRTL